LSTTSVQGCNGGSKLVGSVARGGGEGWGGGKRWWHGKKGELNSGVQRRTRHVQKNPGGGVWTGGNDINGKNKPRGPHNANALECKKKAVDWKGQYRGGGGGGKQARVGAPQKGGEVCKRGKKAIRGGGRVGFGGVQGTKLQSKNP